MSAEGAVKEGWMPSDRVPTHPGADWMEAQ